MTDVTIRALPTAVQAEAASAYQAARANRQIMYQLAKLVVPYRDLYDKAEALYREVCECMGVTPEEVFDEDEYKKSKRYRDILEGRIL